MCKVLNSIPRTTGKKEKQMNQGMVSQLIWLQGAEQILENGVSSVDRIGGNGYPYQGNKIGPNSTSYINQVKQVDYVTE
jgi:hypothetical protein